MRKVCLLFLVFFCLAMASAHAVNLTKDYRWSYELDEDGCATLLHYYSRDDSDTQEEILRVPGEVDGHPVTKLDYSALYGVQSACIVLPASLLDVVDAEEATAKWVLNGVRAPRFYLANQVERFEVEEGNQVFSVVDGVLYKGDMLFSAPPALAAEEITVPEGVTAIFERALWDAQGLERLRLPSTLKTVCTPGIEYNNLMLPNTVKEITVAEGNPAFHVYQDALYQGDTLISVPTAIEKDTQEVEEGTREIAEYAFNCCKGIRAVRLPQGLELLQTRAFYACRNLEEINIPKETRDIGEGAFSYCWELKTCLLDAENPVYRLDNGALIEEETHMLISWFADAEEGKLQIQVPDGIEIIAPCAFTTAANSMNRITLPDSVKEIGYHAFYCADFTEVSLPPLVRIISWGLFENCESLKTVQLPEHLETVKENAFEDCVNLCSITIPDSVESIGDYAFVGCEQLRLAILPKDLKKIPNYAFEGCASLGFIATSETMDKLPDWEREDAEGLAILPEKLANMGYGAFKDCVSLKQIVFPEHLEEMDYYALENCAGLTSAYIPSGSINYYSFAGCESLEWVILGKDVSEVSSSAFNGCSSLKWIKVENDKIDWNDYFSPGEGCECTILVPRADMIPNSDKHTMYALTDFWLLGQGEWTAVSATDNLTARAISVGNRLDWQFAEVRSLENEGGSSWRKKLVITHTLTMRLIAPNGSESSAQERVTLSPGAFSVRGKEVSWQWDEDAGRLTVRSPEWEIVFSPAENREEGA